VWDTAPCHRAQCVQPVGVRLAFLLGYLAELPPVKCVLCEVRRCVESML